MRWISGASLKDWATIALGVVALVGAAGAARAAEVPGSAEQLFDGARGDMKRGDFASARDKLLDSLKLEATVGTLFNLGLCEEKLGFLRDSLQHLRAALAAAANDDKRRPIMTALIGSLEGRVSRVVLKRAQDAGPVLQITLDGRAVQASPDGHEVLVDAGEHQVLVQGPGGPPVKTTVQVHEGETIVKELVWSPEPAAPANQISAPVSAPLTPSGPAPLGERLGVVAVNFGAAAVIAGAVLGAMTIGSKISVDHHCVGAGCDEEGLRVSGEGASYSTASTALTITGLLGIGVGSYALLRPEALSRARATPRARSIGYTAGAVGAAAMVTSAIAAGLALSAKSELLDRCGASGRCDDAEGLDAASRGRTAATVATVALGVGIVGLGVASYSLLVRPRFAPRTDVRLTLSPSAIACAVRF